MSARLVIADGIEAAVTLRVAHEALLAYWPRLARLIEEHRDFLVVRRRLQGDTAAWERHDRHADFLLPPGRRLAEAQEVLAKRGAELDPGIAAYAEASIAAETERQATLQRRKEEDLRRDLRRSRRIAAIVSVFLAAALVAGGVAWLERNAASRAAVEAATAYRVALKQAAGNVQLLVDAHKKGAISTGVMQRLMEQARATVNGLTHESDELTVARAQLMDVLSLAFVTIGDAATGERFADSAASLADALLAKAPNDTAARRLWVEAHGRVGEALFWKGDSTHALPVIRSAMQAAEVLAKDAPDDAQVARDLFEDYARLGDILDSLGDLEGAVVPEKAWIDRAEALSKRRPDQIEWLASLASADVQLGETLRQQQKLPEAAARYQEAITMSADAAAKDPQNASYLEALTVSHEFHADVLMAEGNLGGALAEFETALDLATRLSDGDPANFLRREIVEALHQRVGEVMLARKDYARHSPSSPPTRS